MYSFIRLILMTSLVSLMFFSCATKGKSHSASSQTSAFAETSVGGSNDKTVSYTTDIYMDDLTQDSENHNRLIIYNASLTLTVKKCDSLIGDFERLAKYHGGYLSSFSNDRAILKVRTDRLNTALKEFSNFGQVSSQAIHAQDITTAYKDLELSLENSEKARLRYLELFNQAKTVNEMLTIERELERINGQIDRTKAQINNYDQRIQFAEIVVHVKEKVKPGVLGYIGIGLYKSVKWLFVR